VILHENTTYMRHACHSTRCEVFLEFHDFIVVCSEAYKHFIFRLAAHIVEICLKAWWWT